MPLKREEDYEEEELLVQGEEYEGSEGDDDVDVHEDRPAGGNKKFVIIIAAVFVLIGIATLVITTVVKNKGSETGATTAEQGAASKFEDTTAQVTDPNSNNAQGNKAQPANGQSSASNIDQALADMGVQGAATSGYSETDMQSLRAAGYTGDQITQFSQSGKPVDELLVAAKVERDKFLQDRYKELDTQARINESSDAYKELKKFTWLGGDPKTLVEDVKGNYMTDNITYNATYIKIPLRSNQCLVKVTLDADKGFQPVFLNLHPDRYAKLKDSGSIVVNFDVVTYNGDKYIDNIKEVLIN